MLEFGCSTLGVVNLKKGIHSIKSTLLSFILVEFT